jgi:hypothetical protein
VSWPSLATEFTITIGNAGVWLSIALALALSCGCLLFGAWVARSVGLLDREAPMGETLGVGLASGLMVLAAWWAAIWSSGRSSFTPVAVGFAIAVALAVAQRGRHPKAVDADTAVPAPSFRARSLLLTALAGGVFVVVIALVYGSTMAPSSRDGVQPVEYPDQAFYAVLGRDLATTGTETNLSTAGFSDLQGLPAQTWYHWAELWLASAVIAILGIAPMAARYFIVLPVVLLAAAAMTGTLVRRLGRTSSPRAYLLGVVVCLFLAPVPVYPGPYFSSWAFGLILGITLYGMGAVAAVLGLYGVVVLATRRPTWPLAIFAGSAAAFLLPAHVVIASLALVGFGAAWAVRVVDTVLATRRILPVAPVWGATFLATGVALVASLAWGLFTGHGFGGTGASPPGVSSFNASWSGSVAITLIGAGMFVAIPIAWLIVRRQVPLEADVYLGTMTLVVVGAVAWGARLGDFNMFYVFFGGIAVFATPLAAVAAWRLLERLRNTQHLRLAAAVVVLCCLQLAYGAVINGASSLVESGPLASRRPIPIDILSAIRGLPADAKLAYACRPFEEGTFAEPQLLSIDVHTARRMIPMCFEADVVATLIGAQRSGQTPNSSFAFAPQRALYPDSAARPSSEAVATFLKQHGIEYIYADSFHPNSLVPYAVAIASRDDVVLFTLP